MWFLKDCKKEWLPQKLNHKARNTASMNTGLTEVMIDDTCMVCVDFSLNVQCADTKKLLPEVVEMFKPILCF